MEKIEKEKNYITLCEDARCNWELQAQKNLHKKNLQKKNITKEHMHTKQ